MTKKTDDMDKKILLLLLQNPEISQTELAKQLGVSQPAVSARIRRLKEKGESVHLIGVDVKKAQLFLAKIDISTADPEHLIKFFEKCPLYLNCFLTSGKYNLLVFLIGENMRSIMSCVDSHLRKNPLIKEIEFNIIVTPIREFIIPIKPILEKKEINPCEIDCSNCTLFINNRCLACPASIQYKGTLL